MDLFLQVVSASFLVVVVVRGGGWVSPVASCNAKPKRGGGGVAVGGVLLSASLQGGSAALPNDTDEEDEGIVGEEVGVGSTGKEKVEALACTTTISFSSSFACSPCCGGEVDGGGGTHVRLASASLLPDTGVVLLVERCESSHREEEDKERGVERGRCFRVCGGTRTWENDASSSSSILLSSFSSSVHT